MTSRLHETLQRTATSRASFTPAARACCAAAPAVASGLLAEDDFHRAPDLRRWPGTREQKHENAAIFRLGEILNLTLQIGGIWFKEKDIRLANSSVAARRARRFILASFRYRSARAPVHAIPMNGWYPDPARRTLDDGGGG